MKKISRILVSVMVAALLGTTVTGCYFDDKEDNPVVPEQPATEDSDETKEEEKEKGSVTDVTSNQDDLNWSKDGLDKDDR